MRILAIRGKNLASLADDFEIAFSKGALQTAGLFAITGQTGAGKSTILDALCLALYDEMPRLPDGQGVAIGQAHEEESQRIKSNDVRSILRRGSQHAYAEVDFIGKDKLSYRARWDLRKARGKTLQKQEMLLTNLITGQSIGQGKKETLLAISDKIGLSFEQFRRSVLLAQGDFAAFLKAKKDERSSLLERITGTELYSELSIAAFKRAKTEKELLQNLEYQAKHLLPLSQTERTLLESEINQLTLQLISIHSQLKDTQLMIDWHVELKKRQEAERLASNRLNQCQHNYDNSADIRALIAQVQAVQPLQILMKHYQNANNDYQTSQLKLTQLSDNYQLAIITLETAKNTLINEEQALKLSQERQQVSIPVIKQVREYDTQLEIMHNDLHKLNNELESLQTELSASLLKQSEFNDLKQTQTEQLNELISHLAQYSHYQDLLLQWARWNNELNRYQEITINRNAAYLQKKETEQSLGYLKAQLAQLQQTINENQNLQTQKQTELLALQQQADTISLNNIHAQKDVFEKRREHSQLILNIAKQIIQLKQWHQTQIHQLTQCLQKQSHANESLINLKQVQLINTISLEEARKALALFQASSHQSAQQLRQLLIEGKPCPVCGSLTHFHKEEFMNETINNAQQQRVIELQNQQLVLIKDIAETEKSFAQETEKSVELQHELSNSELQLKQLEGDWQTLNNANDFDALNDDLIVQFHCDYDDINNAYEQLKQQEKVALALQTLVVNKQTTLNEIKETVNKLNSEYANLDKQLTEQLANNTRYHDSIEHYQKQLESIEQILSEPLQNISHWRDYLSNHNELKTIMAFIEKSLQKQLVIKQNLQNTEQALLLITQKLEPLQTQLNLKQHDCELIDKKRQDLMLKRQALLAVEISVEQYEQALAQQVELIRIKQQHALAIFNESHTQVITQKNEQKYWQSESERRYQLLAKAHNDLNEALVKQQLDVEKLNALLLYDEAWLNNTQAQINDVQQALQAAKTLWTIKLNEIKEHENNQVTLNENDAKILLTDLQIKQEQLNNKQHEYLITLRADDNKQVANHELQVELIKQKKCWESWESLNQLIGSANGAKFRVFAQSLTLDALLAHSNTHLKDFAPRYCLQRVPRSDLELQIIDKDMANEVRSVHSLSGGESFLVSLALALGLASLASNKTQVESLFIDEGFGSLDPETLDIAIASLDTLQSLGRKIGIISHVPILVERIGAKVMVEKLGGGRSRVIVTNGW